jgi:hypothetical protein
MDSEDNKNPSGAAGAMTLQETCPKDIARAENCQPKIDTEIIVTNITTNLDFQMRSKIDQLKNVLGCHYDVRYNVVTGHYEFRDYNPVPSMQESFRPMTDRDFNTVWSILSQKYFPKLDEAFLRRVVESDYSPDFNPITDYFNTLPEWDGKIDYIQILAALVRPKPGQESTWFLYLTRWLVANVATMLGRSINHTCLILLGDQGIGKSWWLHRLGISEELTFTGHIVPGDKDSKILAAEKTIINLEELESSTREDWANIKGLITLPQITVRRPYGRFSENLPRRASFCGSSNKMALLGDLTGSRRWLCTEVEKVDYEAVTPELMRKVYSQAFVMLNDGVKFWFDGDEIKEIDTHNQQYSEVCHEEEAVNSIFEAIDFQDIRAEYKTTTEILQELKNKFPSVNFSTRKLGQVLKNLGFQRGIKRIKGDKPLYYYALNVKM